jgi:hypothetical protein
MMLPMLLLLLLLLLLLPEGKALVDQRTAAPRRPPATCRKNAEPGEPFS